MVEVSIGDNCLITPSIIQKRKEWISGAYKEVTLQTGHAKDAVVAQVLAHFKRNSD